MTNIDPHNAGKVSIVEVGPCDGFQSIAQFIPTPIKKGIIQCLHASGAANVCCRLKKPDFLPHGIREKPRIPIPPFRQMECQIRI